MTVKARGNGWQADITLSGTRYRHTFPTKGAALKWEANAKVADKLGEDIPHPSTPQQPTEEPTKGAGGASRGGSDTFHAVAWRVHALRWAGTASDEKVVFNINLLVDYFGRDTRIAEIDADMVDGFVAECLNRRNSNGTINRKMAVLSVIMKYALSRKLVSELPPLERRKEGGGRIRWLTSDEERTLLTLLTKWGKSDHADVVAVLIDTGFRNGELYRLTSRDIDFKAGTVTTWVNKTDHPRTVYMTNRVRDILKRRVAKVESTSLSSADADFLFPYTNTWLRVVWDRARTHLGFGNDPHFIPYICRHTCASRLVQKGVALQVVKEWLGHKSMTMTIRYAHLSPTNLKDAARVLDGSFDAPLEAAE